MIFGEAFILWAKHLIIQFSYLAIFFVGMVSTSTILIPFPIFAVIFFAAGLGLNPLAVGIFSGLGMATGELTGYLVGIGSRSVIEKKKKVIPKIVKFFTDLFQKKYEIKINKRNISIEYAFWVLLFTSAIPFPFFDIIGIVSGVSNYDIKKFYVAVAIGKIIKCLIIAYSGYLIMPRIEEWLWG
jgi:membrane protein YqaA with SNARE-associated domain